LYLKTLELQGFKSFADKTVISFRQGLNVIVGANGSGKSNISDAIRWVLGEMSPKSLRGGKMEDVIFNGTAKRRPAKFAEVIMTIDNSDGLMKIDYDEVSVARRLDRSGESEYFINRKKVRLKDVVELFLNTGIGREGYSVISQGKISEIVSLKSEERRELFEEAAGISKFRYRKNEARNKLATVTENSLRIGDMIADMEQRLPSLERQSAKAQKYVVLRDEKKQLDVLLWASKRRELIKTLSSLRETLSENTAKLSDASASLERVSAESEELYIERQRLETSSEETRNALGSVSVKESELSSEISVLENDIYHFDLSAERLAADKKTYLAGIEELSKLLGEAKASLDALNAQIDEKEASLKAVSEAQALSAETAAKLKEKLDAARAEIDSLTGLKREKELIVSRGEGAARQNAIRAEETAEKIKQAESDLEARRASVKKAGDEALKLLLELSDAEIGAENAAKAREAAQADLDEAYESRQSSKLKLGELNSRRDTLLRMERLFEGFSGSVKEVMVAAEEKRLSGIYGPVSKILTTDEKYVIAVETSLGAGVQNVVVADENAAKAAIDFLKRTRSGRATFLPLTTIRPKTFDPSSIRRHRGFCGVASQLVKSDDKFKPVSDFLLGRTVIGETIDDCAEMARTVNYSVRFVSLDGQVINSGGSFTGGQTINKTGVLSRNADLLRIEEEIEKAKSSLAQADAALKTSSALLAAAEKDEKKALSVLSEIKQKYSAAENAASLEEERAADDESRLAALRSELAVLEEAISLSGSENEMIAKQSEQWNEKISVLEKDCAVISEKTEEENKKREALIAESLSLTEGAAMLRANRDSAEESISSYGERIDSRRTLLESAEKEINELREKKKNAEELLEKDRVSREECRVEIGKMRALLAELSAKIAECEKRSTENRAEEKRLIAEKERFSDACRDLSADVSKYEGEYLVRENYFAEEYEITDDVMESYEPDDEKAAALGGEDRLAAVKFEIKRLGNINMDALEEYNALKEKYDFTSKQFDDITRSKAELEKLIASLEKTMKEQFLDTFEEIRKSFREIFTELFGGGTADIKLSDENDVLNCGIDISIQPPGKLVKSLSLLSGGEQAFVAIAIYFSLLKINPSPFCIFDEIESALDEANVIKYAEYMRRHSDLMQYIAISHRRGTMDAADILYGVTMQEKGVSDYICLEPGNYDVRISSDEAVVVKN